MFHPDLLAIQMLDAHGIKLSSQTQHLTSESQWIGMNRGIKKKCSFNNWRWQYLLPVAWNKTQNFSKQCQNYNIKINHLIESLKGAQYSNMHI